MQAKPKAVNKSFKAVLERMESSNLGWVIVRLPFNVEKVWGARGQLRVKGHINGFAFRGALHPTGRGYHFMLVTKLMQAGGAVRAGATAHFRLEPDLEAHQAVVPAELKRALSEVRSLRRWFDSLSPSMRKWFCDQVTQPKGAAARVRRAEQIAELLLSTMEAERELPPVLQAAFEGHPRAWQGWQRMTPRQRRGNLLGIFHCRGPEARKRRIAKLLDEAAARAGKGSRRTVEPAGPGEAETGQQERDW